MEDAQNKEFIASYLAIATTFNGQVSSVLVTARVERISKTRFVVNGILDVENHGVSGKLLVPNSIDDFIYVESVVEQEIGETLPILALKFHKAINE